MLEIFRDRNFDCREWFFKLFELTKEKLQRQELREFLEI